MWAGVLPAVTTKFTENDELDHAEDVRVITALLQEAHLAQHRRELLVRPVVLARQLPPFVFLLA